MGPGWPQLTAALLPSGIFTCPYGQQQLNHAMLLVGYNTAHLGNYNVNYWILKNR